MHNHIHMKSSVISHLHNDNTTFKCTRPQVTPLLSVFENPSHWYETHPFTLGNTRQSSFRAHSAHTHQSSFRRRQDTKIEKTFLINTLCGCYWSRVNKSYDKLFSEIDWIHLKKGYLVPWYAHSQEESIEEPLWIYFRVKRSHFRLRNTSLFETLLMVDPWGWGILQIHCTLTETALQTFFFWYIFFPSPNWK